MAQAFLSLRMLIYSYWEGLFRPKCTNFYHLLFLGVYICKINELRNAHVLNHFFTLKHWCQCLSVHFLCCPLYHQDRWWGNLLRTKSHWCWTSWPVLQLWRPSLLQEVIKHAWLVTSPPSYSLPLPMWFLMIKSALTIVSGIFLQVINNHFTSFDAWVTCLHMYRPWQLQPSGQQQLSKMS